MTHIPKVLNAFATLLSYPTQHTAQAAELLYIVLHGEITNAAEEITKFGSFLERSDPTLVEESFTSTFDVNPACALEVGWHLFGEEYARGLFLVRMRQELRRFNLPESVELTDHLSHVLAVVAAMPDVEATRFVKACVQPAVDKMNDAIAKSDTPYRHVVSALSIVINSKWGRDSHHVATDILQQRSSELDPLHAFPAANYGCGGGCGVHELISLDTESSSRTDKTGSSHER